MGESRGFLKLDLVDISRAHFYGEARRPVYVTLPEVEEKEGMCGRLLKRMYGTQDASSIWQSNYTELLEQAGFKTGSSTTAIFYHEKEDMGVLVHGDDFLRLADETASELSSFICGANAPDQHRLNTSWSTLEQQPTTLDLRNARAGDACPHNPASKLTEKRGIETRTGKQKKIDRL